MEDDSSVLVTLLLTTVPGEGEVRCSSAETPNTLEALLLEQCMNPQCRSSKQQPYPRLGATGSSCNRVHDQRSTGRCPLHYSSF